MGYSYTFNGGLCCDNCGNSGGVRKRTCPHKVLTSSFRMVPAVRTKLPYCQPPALCSACYHELKPTLHADCADGAARIQAEYDRTEELLSSGAYLRTAAYGDWHKSVPTGRVGIAFRNRSGEESFYHVPADEYGASRVPTQPTDYADAVAMQSIR